MQLTNEEIAIVWSVDDVKMECDWLTDDQALEVLFALKSHHDATIGINWDVIRDTADFMFTEFKGADDDLDN
jgi:hypothetical protein